MPTTERTSGLPADLQDLYDEPSLSPGRPARDHDPVVALLRGLGRDLAVLVGLFAVSLAAFVACVTLVSLGAGLAVLVVGLVVLIAGLVVAGWAARMSRELLTFAGVELPVTRYPGRRPASGAGSAASGTCSPGATCCTCWWPSPSRRSASRWR